MMRLTRTSGLLAFLVTSIIISSFAPARAAQEGGTITGLVTDIRNSPIVGASVKVRGIELATVTGADGKFELENVPAGEQVLEIVQARFQTTQSEALEVGAGQVVETRIRMRPKSAERVLTIEERLAADKERVQLETRRRNEAVGETIGAEEISASVASDVGKVVSRAPGVTINDGKFAFVRGLGGRYSQTLFNGGSLPSPEPEQRVVPLDLFPSSIVRDIAISKSYSPELPGEFGGGSVQIATKDVPESAFLKLGASFKFRNGTTIANFETYEGSKYDRFTFQDGTRELPDLVPSTRLPSAGAQQQIQDIGRDFNNTWDRQSTVAPFDHKLSVTFGDRYELGGIGAVGVVGALSWSNSYKTREEEFLVLENDGGLFVSNPRVDTVSSLDRYTFEAELSALLNVAYELNSGNKVGVRNFVVRSTEDRVVVQDREDPDDIDKVEQFRYVERALYNSQFYGEHLLVGDTFLEWRSSFSLVERDEPDNKQIIYELEGDQFTYADLPGSGRRNFFFLEETVQDFGVDYSIPFVPFYDDPEPDLDRIKPYQRIQFGAAYTKKDRDFDTRVFRFTRAGIGSGTLDEFGNEIDLSAPPEFLFRRESINPQGFVLTETTLANDNYTAEQTLQAAYALVHFRLLPALRVQVGARVESSEQEVVTFDRFAIPPTEVVGEIDETDVLPAFNLTWEVSKRQQIRLAGSQTVSRPEFRELATFTFFDFAGGFGARGNPDLEQATLRSLDLRWEMLPTPDELLSASLFYKEFDDPIERVLVSTGSSRIVTWENADQAELFGFELEARKNLSFISDSLENFSLKLNYAWIESEVEIRQSATTVQTNDKRELEGQPDFVVNAGLFYDNPESGWSASVLVGSSGEKITGVGSFGLDDQIQRPRIDLDFTIAKKFGDQTIRLTGENLLDDEYRFRQNDITTREYRAGWAVGLSYSVSF